MLRVGVGASSTSGRYGERVRSAQRFHAVVPSIGSALECETPQRHPAEDVRSSQIAHVFSDQLDSYDDASKSGVKRVIPLQLTSRSQWHDFSWIFEDLRRDEDLPYDSMLERFRLVRDEKELRMRSWLEHPEAELASLPEERKHESQKRLEEAADREREAARTDETRSKGRDAFRRT